MCSPMQQECYLIKVLFLTLTKILVVESANFRFFSQSNEKDMMISVGNALLFLVMHMTQSILYWVVKPGKALYRRRITYEDLKFYPFLERIVRGQVGKSPRMECSASIHSVSLKWPPKSKLHSSSPIAKSEKRTRYVTPAKY